MSITKRVVYGGVKPYKDRIIKQNWVPGESRDVELRDAGLLLRFKEFTEAPMADNVLHWDMRSLGGAWEMANQGDGAEDKGHAFIAAAESYDGGALRVQTAAESNERKKIRTLLSFGTGVFRWRAYISDLSNNDQCSIGCWLYKDDSHELDFEVYHGKAVDRLAAGARDDEVLALISSQDLVEYRKVVCIKKNAWHDFEIDLDLTRADEGWVYAPKWRIDGVEVGSVQLEYGQGHPYRIFCSVENLTFTGDHLPTKDNYALFDSVSYTPYEHSINPFILEQP